MRFVLSSFIFLVVFTAAAQDATISKRKFHWGGSQQDTTAGYTQAILTGNVL